MRFAVFQPALSDVLMGHPNPETACIFYHKTHVDKHYFFAVIEDALQFAVAMTAIRERGEGRSKQLLFWSCC